jgi:hypothetical protein
VFNCLKKKPPANRGFFIYTFSYLSPNMPALSRRDMVHEASPVPISWHYSGIRNTQPRTPCSARPRRVKAFIFLDPGLFHFDGIDMTPVQRRSGTRTFLLIDNRFIALAASISQMIQISSPPSISQSHCNIFAGGGDLSRYGEISTITPKVLHYSQAFSLFYRDRPAL